MKFKTVFSFNFKNKINFLSLLLICGILLNTYASFSNSSLFAFFAEPDATISVSSTEVCKDESVMITFTGSGGVAPYTFTYELNNGTSIEITTTSGNSIDITLDGTTVGDFTYKLTNVEESGGDSQVITDQEETITVNALPIVDFSFTNDTACSGETVQFTNTSTGTGILTYNWNFGDGSSSTQETPNHVFEALGCATATFNVALTVTDENGCSSSQTEIITVIEKPDIRFRDQLTGLNEFSNCGNTSSSSSDYEITLENISTSTCISSFFIDWGDGTSTISAIFPATHTYTLVGVFEIRIVADGNTGCQNEVTYQVKNISNPGGGFSSPGATSNLCAPTNSLIFGITNWGLNSSDTEYIVDFGDGSTIEQFTQAQLEASASYNSSNPENSLSFPTPHIYLEGTCSEVDGEFVATLTVQNACGSTDFTISNITILEPSTVEFDAVEESCINKNIVFDNLSLISDGANCIKEADFIWDFGDGTTIVRFAVDTSLDENHTYTTAGTYTVSLTIESFCTTETFTKEICIEPEITPVFSVDNEQGCIPFIVNATNNTDQSELCSTPIYGWTVNYTSDNCGTTSDWAYTNGTDATSENPQFIFNTSGKYTLTQSITTECGTETVTKIIDVKKPPTASIQEIADVCGAVTINPTATVENCTSDTASLIYNWTFTGGSITSSNTLNPGNIEYTTPGIYTVTLQVTNDCGVSNTATEQFEVFEKPVITNTTLTQEICSNQSTSEIILTASNSNTTYSWTAASSSGITGFLPNGNSNTIPAQILINLGNSAGTVIYTVIPVLDGCAGDAIEFIVTVNPTPIISTQPISSEICLSGTATLLEVAYQNGTGTPNYQWFSNTTDTNSGGSLITGATNASYDPPTDAVGTIYYYAVISFSSGGCLQIVSDTGSVNVVPQITVSTVNSLQAVCEGGTANELEVIFSGGTGNATYQWFSNSINSNTGGTLITGETTSTFTPNAFSAAGDFYYYAEISLDGNGCTAASSTVFEINVLTDPIIDTQAISLQELCQGATPTDLTITVSGGTTSVKTYQWYQNTNNNTTSGILIPSANSATYTPVTSTVGTFYYYVIVSQPESGCEVTSTISELIINEAPTFSTQPISSEICLNGTATLLEVAYQNGTGTPSYQWFSNTTDTNSGGSLITGATNSSYDPPTDTVGTIYYYAEISFSSGGCLQIVSDTASVNVVPQITVSTVNSLQAVCEGGTANELEVTFSGGTGNATYQWFSNTSNSNTGGTLITGETTSTFTPNAFSTAGDFYYYAEISLDGNGCTAASSTVFEINVLTDPIIDTQAIALQELCQGATPTDLTITVSGGTTSVKTYQWYQNTTSNTSGGVAISGETSATYTPVTLTVGTFYYYVIVSQPESGCEVTSTISELIINEAPTFSTQPISSEICLNGTATLLEVAYQNGTGTPSYQWFSNTTDTNSGGSLITGATNSSYDPPTDTVGTIYYYAEISFSSGGCLQIVSDTASVNVVPQITVSTVNSLQAVCEGGTANELEVTFSGGTGNATYQWFSNTSNSNTGGTLITGETTSTFTPNAFSTAGDFYYYAEISLDGNGCTAASSTVFEINVLTDPIIDTQAIALQELCQGATPTDLTITVSGGTTSVKTYQWYQNTTSNTSGGVAISGETSATYTPVTLTVGTFYYYVIVSQPESGCEVTSTISELIINEAPTFSTQPISSEICLNGTATLLEVAYQNGTGTPSYQWFSNTTDTNSGGSLITGATNASYDPPTDTVGTIYYYAEISFSSGGCLQIVSDTASVIVNEIPVISSAEITIYSEDTFNFNPNTVAGNTVPIGTKYTWSFPTFNPAGSIIGASSEINPQDQISQTLENTETFPVKVTYIITPATTKCIGIPFTLEVTVNPSIKSNTVVINNSCFESNDGAISINIIGGIPFETGNPYLISWSGPNGFASADANITNLEAGLYILRIEDRNGISITEEWSVTQPDILVITKDLEKNISCFEGNDGAIAVTISGGTLSYTYNWTTSDGSGIVLNAENQNGLTAGTYTLEVIDQNNCTVSTNVTLTQPEGLEIETIFKQDVLCFGDATGVIEINVSGGTLVEISPGVFDYLYSWSGPNSFTSTSRNISNLIAGTYTIAVTDNLGCTTNTSIIINQSPEVEINYVKTDVTCYGEANGSIDVTVTGGKAPYQISWSNLANGFSLSNLSADTYIATITDDNNCIKQVSITIEQPVFFIDPIVTSISCNGENDGTIDLNLTGGIAPFSVTWSDDASAGVQRNNLAAGTYTVLILDSDTYQCPIEETFIITNPPAIAVSTIVTDAIDCDIVNSGSIDLETSGGSAPYSFLWNTGETTEDIENIPPGDYSVEITDRNGCKATKQFNIFRQEPLTISYEETTIVDCVLKTVSKQNTANATGGYVPYTYTWSDGVVSGTDNSVMTTMQSGSYTLTVTDAIGCIKSTSFIVDVPAIGDADFSYSAFALTTYDLLSIEDPIQFTNLSTGNYSSVQWDFGDGSPTSNEENPVHTYEQVGSFNIVLTVEFDIGCTEIFERTITITKGYSLIHPTAFTPNDDGYNETIRPSYRGFIDIKMTIYDTWGTVVYSEEGIDLKGWNGFIGNKPAENGNYVMVVKGITFYEKEIIKNSPVTLLK